MTDHTPTTREVKEWYADSIDRLGGGAEFDRWLADVIRKAKDEAWQEGLLSAGLDLDYTMQIMSTNPYTEET